MGDSRRGPVEPDAKTLVMEHSTVRDGAVTLPRPAPGFGGRYDFVEPIGRGGMGVVVVQHDTLIGRRVAMKVMHGSLGEHETHRARFVREARIQGQLEHPAVVPVYDLGLSPEGELFFTMKRVRGDTLTDILDGQWRGDRAINDKYSLRKLLSALSSVCLAIQFAHERGVLHRDLKPENVMLGDFGEVYVLDWGLAQLSASADGADDLAPLSSPGDVMGTPGYMAPEQALGVDDEITTATDVYALGVILFEVLTLRRLHEGEDNEQVIASTLAGANAAASQRAPDRNVPPELEQLCIAATQLDPIQRPPSARAMHAAIEAYLDGERDEELRQKAAHGHASEAAHFVQQARLSDDLSMRRRAMQELGRALALDPGSPGALEALVELLTLPPKQTPPEVEHQISLAHHARKVAIARVATVAYPLVLLFFPLFFWVGVRDIAPLLLIGGAGLAAGGGSWWVTRHSTAEDGDIVAIGVLCASTVAFALSATLYGPLIIAPGAVLINTLSFAIYLPRRSRWIPLLVGFLGMGIPFGLEIGGVTQAYVETGGAVQIMEQALALDTTKMLIIGTAATGAGILVGIIAAGWFADLLVESEGRLLLRDWHLRQILGHPAADGQPGETESGAS